MITLNTDKHSITVAPLEATTKRYEQFEKYRLMLQEQINKTNQQQQITLMAKLLAENKQAARLITLNGGYHPVELQARVERLKSKNYTAEQALTLATESMQEEIAVLMSEDARVFHLFSGTGKYPRTLNACAVAIEVIQATADTSNLSAQDKKLLTKKEFWDNVPFEGVAAYADLFLEQYKRD